MTFRLPRTGRTVLVALAAALLTAAPLAAADIDLELGRFARNVGLQDMAGFVETVGALRADGHLPSRYVSKRRAERLGWRPGLDLCRLSPGDAIGGDPFKDHAHALPSAAGRRWREADLDERCARDRGRFRLIWSNDGLIYMTPDHYRSFIPVPGGSIVPP